VNSVENLQPGVEDPEGVPEKPEHVDMDDRGETAEASRVPIDVLPYGALISLQFPKQIFQRAELTAENRGV